MGLSAAPPVELGNRHRKDLLAEEATEVFSLGAGEVTQILVETKNYVIYKVVNKEAGSESDLAKSIAAHLTERKFKESMKSVLDSATVDLNETYFGTPSTTPETPVSPHSAINH
jgi:hypothetical protein